MSAPVRNEPDMPILEATRYGEANPGFPPPELKAPENRKHAQP